MINCDQVHAHNSYAERSLHLQASVYDSQLSKEDTLIDNVILPCNMHICNTETRNSQEQLKLVIHLWDHTGDLLRP
jgi:hypothetical protein